MRGDWAILCSTVCVRITCFKSYHPTPESNPTPSYPFLIAPPLILPLPVIFPTPHPSYSLPPAFSLSNSLSSPPRSAYTTLDSKVRELGALLPLLKILRAPAMRPRHWAALQRELGAALVPESQEFNLVRGGRGSGSFQLYLLWIEI